MIIKDLTLISFTSIVFRVSDLDLEVTQRGRVSFTPTNTLVLGFSVVYQENEVPSTFPDRPRSRLGTRVDVTASTGDSFERQT